MGTPMTPEEKTWIDNASYSDLLYHWRFASIGDPMFIGETGQYYKGILKSRRDADPAGHIAASKSIGWEQ